MNKAQDKDVKTKSASAGELHETFGFFVLTKFQIFQVQKSQKVKALLAALKFLNT